MSRSYSFLLHWNFASILNYRNQILVRSFCVSWMFWLVIMDAITAFKSKISSSMCSKINLCFLKLEVKTLLLLFHNSIMVRMGSLDKYISSALMFHLLHSEYWINPIFLNIEDAAYYYYVVFFKASPKRISSTCIILAVTVLQHLGSLQINKPLKLRFCNSWNRGSQTWRAQTQLKLWEFK